MFLRQQVIVLERQVTRPKLTQGDRQLFVLLAKSDQRLAGSSDRCDTGYPDRLALVGLQAILASLYPIQTPFPIVIIDSVGIRIVIGHILATDSPHDHVKISVDDQALSPIFAGVQHLFA